MGDFSKQKIVYKEIAMEPSFFVDDGKFVIEATCFMLTTKHPYYLALTLSSKLFYFIFRKFFTTAELGKSAYRYKKIGIIELPVIPAENLPNETITKINLLYQQRVNNKETNVIKSVENEIDSLIYNLYGISEEEIEYINKS